MKYSAKSEFKVFQDSVEKGGILTGLLAKGAATIQEINLMY